MRLVDRVVKLDASLTDTWQTLIDAPGWPRWMPVRSVETHPPGHIDSNTSAVIHWNSGRPMTVVVDEFRPGRSFRWSGSFLGSKISYDHVATAMHDHTEVLFILEVTGPTARLLAPWLRKTYDHVLDEAIPELRHVAADR